MASGTSLGAEAAAVLRWCLAVLAPLLAFSPATTLFWTPEETPRDYAKNQVMSGPSGLKVSELLSPSGKALDYYSLPFHHCAPDDLEASEEILYGLGQRVKTWDSLYELSMRKDIQCQVLCRIPRLQEKEAAQFAAVVRDGYRADMILDHLPVAMVRWRASHTPVQDMDKEMYYERGFPLGYSLPTDEPEIYVHNHLRFHVLYNLDRSTGSSRVVGFEVEPLSGKHSYDGAWAGKETALNTCEPQRMTFVNNESEPQPVKAGEEVIFTYDMMFTESPIKWASRWDIYVNTESHARWIGLQHAVAMVVVFAAVISVIMLWSFRANRMAEPTRV